MRGEKESVSESGKGNVRGKGKEKGSGERGKGRGSEKENGSGRGAVAGSAPAAPAPVAAAVTATAGEAGMGGAAAKRAVKVAHVPAGLKHPKAGAPNAAAAAAAVIVTVIVSVKAVKEEVGEEGEGAGYNQRHKKHPCLKRSSQSGFCVVAECALASLAAGFLVCDCCFSGTCAVAAGSAVQPVCCYSTARLPVLSHKACRLGHDMPLQLAAHDHAPRIRSHVRLARNRNISTHPTRHVCVYPAFAHFPCTD